MIAALGTVADWMSRKPVAVPSETSVGEVLSLMRAREIRHVLVMQAGRLAGIFSNRDVRRVLIGGEHRVSNYLLWQSSYAELVFLDVLWPDFDEQHLRAAVDEYRSRRRRFGKV